MGNSKLTVPLVFTVDPTQGTPNARPIELCGAYEDNSGLLAIVSGLRSDLNQETADRSTADDNINTRLGELETRLLILEDNNPSSTPPDQDTPQPPTPQNLCNKLERRASGGSKATACEAWSSCQVWTSGKTSSRSRKCWYDKRWQVKEANGGCRWSSWKIKAGSRSQTCIYYSNGCANNMM